MDLHTPGGICYTLHMSEIQANKKKLIVHIKRLQGQLGAVIKELDKPNTDCTKSSNTLFAAVRSFSSLKQDFVKCFLEQEFLGSKKTRSQQEKLTALLNLIKS